MSSQEIGSWGGLIGAAFIPGATAPTTANIKLSGFASGVLNLAGVVRVAAGDYTLSVQDDAQSTSTGESPAECQALVQLRNNGTVANALGGGTTFIAPQVKWTAAASGASALVPTAGSAYKPGNAQSIEVLCFSVASAQASSYAAPVLADADFDVFVFRTNRVA